TRSKRDWSADVCSSDIEAQLVEHARRQDNATHDAHAPHDSPAADLHGLTNVGADRGESLRTQRDLGRAVRSASLRQRRLDGALRSEERRRGKESGAWRV